MLTGRERLRFSFEKFYHDPLKMILIEIKGRKIKKDYIPKISVF